MTIDDDNSIYVGGLPYDSTEDDIRRVFDLYGAVVAVKEWPLPNRHLMLFILQAGERLPKSSQQFVCKEFSGDCLFPSATLSSKHTWVSHVQIINDRDVGGKCYGFVTFTNPRSAIDAINDMNGRTIGGRVVRVNEVRTRGGRMNFNRENFHRDMDRDMDWDRGRERERDHDRDRDRHRDRYSDRSRDRDREREREYESGHDHDRTRDRILDHDKEDHDQERNRSRDLDWDRDQEREREMDNAKEHDRSRDKDKEQQSKARLGIQFGDRRSRELSSNSSDEYHDQVKEQLEISNKRHDELQNEIAQIEEKYEEKEKLVSDLQKKAQKLEDALVAAKKLTSQQQTQMAKLQRGLLQVKEYSERLKSSEQELQSLVDVTMIEADEGEEIGARDGTLHANGKV